MEAWEINQRLIERLLKGVPGAGWGDRYASRARTVLDQFIHIHHVRRRWLEVMAPEWAGGLVKFGKEDQVTPEGVGEALRASGAAMGKALAVAKEKGRIKGFKRSPETFLAYLVAHEAYHRALIAVALKVNGHGFSPEEKFGMWEWDTI